MISNWLIVDIYTILILVCIAWFSRKKEIAKNDRGKLFSLLIISTLVLLVGDIFRNHTPNSNIAKFVYILGNFITYIYGPFVFLIMYKYLNSWLKRNVKRDRIWTSFFTAYILINMLFVIESFRSGLVDQYTTYSKLTLIIRAIFYAMLQLYITFYREEMKSSYRNTIMGFLAFPFIFTLIQLGSGNIPTEYMGLAIVYLMLMMNIQRKDMNEDALTGATNRRMFNIEIEDRIENARKGILFSAFMVDIDLFKKINDNYGHDYGDKVLKDVSHILQRSFRPQDVVARYGGDEFCILTDVTDEKILERMKTRINQRMEAINKINSKGPQVSLSIGYAVYDDKELNAIDFIHKIDEKMYKQKEENHNILKETATTIWNE